MRKLGKHVKDAIDNDPFYKLCARRDEGNCKGRITIEHALIYAGRQIDEIFACLPICAYHHEVDQYAGGGGMDKKKHEWIAISRMTESDRIKYSRRPWGRDLALLENKYGKYNDRNNNKISN